jgi:GNAT superfamily N-acetyltransferase
LTGFVSWWPPENFIHNLFVHVDYQRCGVGRALLKACLDNLGRPSQLKCVQQNVNALAFYKRLGWSVIAEGMAVEGPYFLLELKS